MGVYIPYTSYDYTKMQGPAPSGFHVPLSSEWQAVRDIRVALGGGSSDGTNFGIALKMPFAGYRLRSNAGVGNQGTYGFYWSSSRYNENNAYILNFYSFALSPQNNFSRAYGHSVRCFKDIPTIPTSSWTKLYGTSIESGGIFWSSADGLISLSSDGQTWITIQDKNLGATTVWNSGDTLSEANCGKYYQWGNNYGFPRTGSVTTSSTQVDASNYGPGNYYSSSTFIKRSSSPYRWDTTDNGNLWGGVTGVNHMSELKNAYIGEVYEYSYDFRGKSSTILTNDGWTVTGSLTFNSNGMSGNGPSVSRSLPTRNTANKITLTHTFDVRSGGSSLFRIGTMSNGSLTNVSGSYTLQGSYRRITIANSATNYNGVNNGTYTLVMTLDLVNDTWEVTTTGLSTQTGTITSTQKATILANMNNILADTYSSNGGYLQSLSVKIE